MKRNSVARASLRHRKHHGGNDIPSLLVRIGHRPQSNTRNDTHPGIALFPRASPPPDRTALRFRPTRRPDHGNHRGNENPGPHPSAAPSSRPVRQDQLVASTDARHPSSASAEAVAGSSGNAAENTHAGKVMRGKPVTCRRPLPALWRPHEPAHPASMPGERAHRLSPIRRRPGGQGLRRGSIPQGSPRSSAT